MLTDIKKMILLCESTTNNINLKIMCLRFVCEIQYIL